MKLQRPLLIPPLLLLALGLVGSTVDSYAQLMKLPDETSFSPQSVNLLDWFAPAGTLEVGEAHVTEVDASRLDSVYGVTYVAEGGGSPRLGSVRLFPADWFYDDVLVNAPVTGTSANRSLILQFRLPLRRLGLFLGGAPPGLRARISAYTAKSQLLGTVEQELTNAVRGTFVGVETAAGEGISSAVLDYGEEEAPELIHRLLVDFVSPPQFRAYVPQIAAGKAGSVTYVTTINIKDLRGGRLDFPVQVNLFSSSGEPLALPFNGQEASHLPLTVRPFAMAVLASDPSAELQLGYGVIESPRPVVVDVEYQVSSSEGSALSRATFRGGEAKLFQASLVEVSPNSQTDTGIAILNPHARAVLVELTPVEESGDRPEGIQPPGRRIRLEPGAQRAFMLSELCSLPDISGSSCNFPTGGFTGQLHIRGHEPVVVTTLRLLNGLPETGLTVRSLEPDF
jgi:hypothetical protein